MFEWNPVFNFAMNIKHNYLKKFGKVEYKKYEIEENDTTKTVSCLECWIKTLNDETAKEKIKYLEINQEGGILSLSDMVNSVQTVMVNTKLLLKTSGMQIMDFSWSAEVW